MANQDDEFRALQREREIATERWAQLVWNIFDRVEPPYTSELFVADVSLMIDRAVKVFLEKHPKQ